MTIPDRSPTKTYKLVIGQLWYIFRLNSFGNKFRNKRLEFEVLQNTFHDVFFLHKLIEMWWLPAPTIRELKHQTFSRGRRQPELKFTSGPRFPPTWSAVATLRRLCFAHFDVACKTWVSPWIFYYPWFRLYDVRAFIWFGSLNFVRIDAWAVFL